MATLSRRDRILNELRKESNGSFATVYRALTQVSSENNSNILREKDVFGRIKKIMEGGSSSLKRT